MNILFTGVGRRVELLQAFRNAALVLNKDLKIYGADVVETAPALVFCDYARRVVGMKEPSYIEGLLSICVADHIDLVIPTIDTDLVVLSQNKKKFEDIGTKVLISSLEMIQICRDKNNTSKFFEKCGLYTPETVKDWEKYRGKYPAFIKPKDGSSSINAYKVENIEELEKYSKQIRDYIVQPFIEGREYTIDIFCDWDGRPVSIVPRERVQIRAGEVTKTRIELDQIMIKEAKILCSVFKPCGPITVQLIRDEKSGRDYFIEINPRFGGGAPLSMKAGARSAEAILRMLDGEEIEYMTDISDGVVYSRYEQSVCTVAGKSKIEGVIFDLDDTLYSEKEYIRSGYKAVSEFLGGKYEDKLWYYFEAGKPAIDELLKEIHREDEREMVLSIYRNHKPQISLYDNVIEIIQEMKNREIKIGIITDGRTKGQRNKIEALGLEKMMDDIIITDELGGTQFRKPCDIAFRIMQNRWRLPANKIMYIADNPVKDFQAPQKLGMKSVFFKNKDSLYSYKECSNCIYEISALNEIFTVL